MSIAETIGKQIFKAAVPIALELALDNMDEIRNFLHAEAKKTDNSLDDLIVTVAVDWLENFLEELKDQIDG